MRQDERLANVFFGGGGCVGLQYRIRARGMVEGFGGRQVLVRLVGGHFEGYLVGGRGLF